MYSTFPELFLMTFLNIIHANELSAHYGQPPLIKQEY